MSGSGLRQALVAPLVWGLAVPIPLETRTMQDTAERLLATLKEEYQGGQALARSFGVDWPELWKQAQRLRQQGYPVEIAVGRSKGLRWAPGTPTALALEAALKGRLGRPYRYFGNVESTQDELRRWAQKGEAEGALVVAERQKAGRGRRGKAWHSLPGQSLSFSLLLRPSLGVEALSLLPLAAGVALREAAGVGALKWPNDLLAPDGRKLGGVLLEAKLRKGVASYALLGVGLNVHKAPPEAAAVADWLPALERRKPTRPSKKPAPRPVPSRVIILSRFLKVFEVQYALLAKNPGAVLEAWREQNCTLGREVRITTPSGTISGTARDIAEDGSLIVDTPQGPKRVSAGEVDLVGML